jgi:Taurine catabolism dioxygenase TauD, TfdA family
VNDAPLPPTQQGPAAWIGADMTRRDDWIEWFDAAELAEIDEALRHACSRNTDPALWRAADFPLPTLAPRLARLRTELLHGRGFVLLRGLTVAQRTVADLARIFVGLGTHLGHARSQNARGHLLGHVCDLGLSSSDPNVRIYQTRERQSFHTDSCDVVGLLCLREAKSGGDSLLVSALTLFNRLRESSPHLVARLLRPLAHDRRGEVPAGAAPYFLIAPLSWHAGQLTVFYQRQYFDSAQRFADAPRLSAEDVAALDAFDALANDPQLHLRMRLAPGDMQFVHNHNLLHDRTAFEDWPQPEARRHLLRLWLACPGARELPSSFAARYGSLVVGDRGGIVVPGMTATVPFTPA